MKLKNIVDNISGFHTLSLRGECIEHNHTLGFSNETKRNSALIDIGARRIANGYSASAVTATLRPHGGSRPHVEAVLYAAGGGYLNRQDAINARRAWSRANLDARLVGADFPIEVQMCEAKGWLHFQGYKAKCLIATRENDGQPSQGLVFADESRLETLRHRGWLTLTVFGSLTPSAMEGWAWMWEGGVPYKQTVSSTKKYGCYAKIIHVHANTSRDRFTNLHWL